MYLNSVVVTLDRRRKKIDREVIDHPIMSGEMMKFAVTHNSHEDISAYSATLED